ncbi:DUF4031 domain-containing protein [Marinicauda sp. Alg238-R41]|uniref:DUF4031 domain-containing protein n=1 Tax=Marinicauda sp. Alg238-R41 TaxID=2993447 RepID=UPI0022E32052|nr:DUF4031 domain-containing protein [Marinicauda sp. Alg238-R41]
MALYVDDPIHKLGRMIMAHMTADTLEELHRAADALGLPRQWYQGPPRTAFAHYDLCKANQARARRELGAVIVRPRIIAQKARALGCATSSERQLPGEGA